MNKTSNLGCLGIYKTKKEKLTKVLILFLIEVGQFSHEKANVDAFTHG